MADVWREKKGAERDKTESQGNQQNIELAKERFGNVLFQGPCPLTLEREINKKHPASKTPCNVACLQENYKTGFKATKLNIFEHRVPVSYSLVIHI